MSKRLTKGKTFVAVLAIAAFTSTCSTNKRADVISMKDALTTSNGLAQNGLTTNALWNNALWNNALWNNALWNNALWNNALWNNALWNNALWNNALWNNALWNNGLTGDGAMPGNTLRASGYARQLLQYIYSCAMPAGYSTTLDPNLDAPIGCASDTDCKLGYSCLQAKCVIPLEGAGANGSGLAVNADGTTWWADAKCDETCQRWVSACVLARTNAYGVRVQISMRAPSDAPQAIKDALEVGESERNTFTLREGAFYGNLFATTPLNTTMGPCTTLPDGTVRCDADGPIISTPQYFGCAGPGSNIPQVTKRFCSSQGDQSVIKVPGLCLATAIEGGTCAAEDIVPDSATFGALRDCHTTATTAAQAPCTDARDPTCYQEVITVYLKQPIAVCGNAVCEDDGKPTSPETAESCPSDCHATTWARTFSAVFREQTVDRGRTYGGSALAPDGSVVLVGTAPASTPIDFGGGALTGGTLGIVRLGADGKYVSGRRLNPPIAITAVDSVAVEPNGTIVVLGHRGTPGQIWLGKFDPAGNLLLPAWPIALGDAGRVGLQGKRLAIDGSGNLLITASFDGTATFATQPTPVSLTNTTPSGDLLALKVSSAGIPLWAVSLGAGYLPAAIARIAVDPDGNVLVARDLVPTALNDQPHIFKLSGSDGSVMWDSIVEGIGAFCGLAADHNGDVYAAVNSRFSAVTNQLTKFSSAEGSVVWTEDMPFFYGGGACFGSDNLLTLASDGTLVHGALFSGNASFATGVFNSYATPDVLIAGYTTENVLPGQTHLRWAKQLPLVLSGWPSSMSIDAHGQIVVSGSYSGSMQADGAFLVTQTPEQQLAGNAFLASFASPTPLDTTPPVIGIGTDPEGTQLNTVPRDIVVEANGPNGTIVFFMPPTALDTGVAGIGAGTNVACSPPPNTMFPIGTTQVTCTASDPLGNSALATFTVTVRDTLGPVFSSIPDISVQATSSGGAIVPFAPTATDQVSGARPVTCMPASGSQFAVGTTTVRCTASDTRNSQSAATFQVTVTPPLFGAPCTSTEGCGAGTCVDGVCCNTTPAGCGQCQACNVPGFFGACTATTGTSCSDGNACTRTDTCQAGVCVGANPVTCAASDQCHVAGTCNPSTGACVGGPTVSCNDQNPCTVDTCNALSGCVNTPGNTGAICRAAASACDTAEVCTGSSASCPSNADAQRPTLGAGTNQTIVGNCSGSQVVFSVPSLANSSCESGANVTCTWTSGSSRGTCAKSGNGASLPGNRYGTYAITCTATDAAGNVSAPVAFSVTVLQPLTIKIQPPLSGDNNTVNNVVKLGSTVPNKVRLYACGTNVTTTASVTVKLGTTYVASGGAGSTQTITSCTDTPDSGGVMKLDGSNYRYNLSTKGLSATAGIPAFYQENFTVAYKSAPHVVVGTDTVQIDLK